MNTLIVASFCALSSLLASDAFGFGRPGVDGQNGRAGMPGASGRTLTVFAQGEEMDIQAGGESGSEGSNADDGRDASQCYQDKPPYNIVGASGGRGGDGGLGGRGGDGGDVTIYYTDINNLKKVRVDTSPGYGADGGRGGVGGRGCYCRERSWVIRRCHQERDSQGRPITVCRNYTYYCDDGRNGERGRDSLQSRDGDYGALRLVHSATRLGPEALRREIDYTALGQGPYELLRLRWIKRAGAASLLASGSAVADEYLTFDSSQRWNVSFAWNNRRSPELFAGHSLDLDITKGALVVSAADSDVWLETSVSGADREPVVSVDRIVLKDELSQYSMAILGDESERASLEVIDHGQISDQVDTRFDIKVQSAKFIFRKTLFKGAVPPSLVTYRDHVFMIALDQLPGAEGWLSSGKKLAIHLTATQSLGGKSKATRLKAKLQTVRNARP